MAIKRVYRAKNLDDVFRIAAREKAKFAAWKKSHPNARAQTITIELPI